VLCALARSILLVFPVSCHAVPSFLLSFPTRRSSDLQVGGLGRIKARVGQDVALDDAARDVELGLVEQAVVFLRILRVLGGRHAVDRKSTRLNSSHVKISYVVFCLKKKRRYIACAA